MIRKALLLGGFIVCNFLAAFAQKQGPEKIPEYQVPISRQLFHDNINAEQKLLLGSDGKTDSLFNLENHEEQTFIITDAITRQVDWLQYQIETDTKIEPRIKTGYLVGLTDILRHMRLGWRKKEVAPSHFAQIIALYKKLMEANELKESLVPYLQHFPYDIVYTATLPRIFEENPGYAAVADILLVKYSRQYPNKTFQFLTNYTHLPHADSLIKSLGRAYPEQLYTYAQAPGKLGNMIRNIKNDDFIKTVVSLSQMKSGQIYFPFLDNLVKGKLTIAQLDAAKDDRLKYYLLFVQKKI